MFSIRFDLSKKGKFGEMDTDDKAYELVVDMIQVEISRSARAIRRFLALIDLVRVGVLPTLSGCGEDYFFDIGAALSEIHCGAGRASPSVKALPTEWLVSAVEQWLAHVLTHHGDDSGHFFSDSSFSPPRNDRQGYASAISDLTVLTMRETPGTHGEWLAKEMTNRLRTRSRILLNGGTLEEGWGAPQSAARPDL